LSAIAAKDLIATKTSLTIGENATLKATSGKIDFNNVTATINKELQITAGTNWTVLDSTLSAGTTATLNADNNIAIDTVTLTAQTLSATAANDLTATDTSLTTGGNTTFIAQNGNAIFDRVGLSANKAAITTGNNIEFAGRTTVDTKTDTTFTANNNILFGDTLTITGGNLNLNAVNGEVIDRNDDLISESKIYQIDIDASAAIVTIAAATGIGSTNALETNAGTFDLTTRNGNIVISEKDNVTITKAVADNGFIDLYSGNTLIIDQKIVAGGNTENSVLIGAKNSIIINAGAELLAGGNLSVIAGDYDIIGRGTVDNPILLKAGTQFTGSDADISGTITFATMNGFIGGDNGNMQDGIPIATDLTAFIANFAYGKTMLVSTIGLNITNVNPNAFSLDGVISGGGSQLFAPNATEMSVDQLVSKLFDTEIANGIITGQSADASIDLTKYVSSDYNQSNRDLLSNKIDVVLTGSMTVKNRAEGGSMTLEKINLQTDNLIAEYIIDNIVISSVTSIASGNGITVAGNDGGVADSAVIKEIVSENTFILEHFYVDSATVTATQLYGDLIINDATLIDHGLRLVKDLRTGETSVTTQTDGLRQSVTGQASLDVNNILTEIDAMSKVKTDAYDFWLWTLDGNYSLIASFDGIAYDPVLLVDHTVGVQISPLTQAELSNWYGDSMRAIEKTQMVLLLNGDASYTNTAFGLNMNDWTHPVPLNTEEIARTSYASIILSDDMPFNSFSGITGNTEGVFGNNFININGVDIPILRLLSPQNNEESETETDSAENTSVTLSLNL
jgi:hypothetical protein